jgi:hypothetical protein
MDIAVKLTKIMIMVVKSGTKKKENANKSTAPEDLTK